MKICNKCGMEQPVTNFHKNHNTRDGLQRICKACGIAYRDAHEKVHREVHREYTKAYYNAHREEQNEKSKQYRANHREKNHEYNRSYNEAHREKTNERKKQYNANHKEERREYEKQHKEHKTEYGKQRYIEHRDTMLKANATWRKNNPEAHNMHQQSRRARKAGLARTLTPAQWKHILEKFNNTCAYCGVGDKTLHQEHFVSVTAGGEYTHNNIIPSCQSCNSSKGTKEFFTWYPTSEHYDKHREAKIMKFLHYTGNAQQLTLCLGKEDA